MRYGKYQHYHPTRCAHECPDSGAESCPTCEHMHYAPLRLSPGCTLFVPCHRSECPKCYPENFMDEHVTPRAAAARDSAGETT